jgi:hypothetical protein
MWGRAQQQGGDDALDVGVDPVRGSGVYADEDSDL